MTLDTHPSDKFENPYLFIPWGTDDDIALYVDVH